MNSNTTIREIKQRLAQISSGPWYSPWDAITEKDQQQFRNSSGPILYARHSDHDCDLVVSEPDASFIVNAESDIRFLLAEIERLQVR